MKWSILHFILVPIATSWYSQKVVCTSHFTHTLKMFPINSSCWNAFCFLSGVCSWRQSLRECTPIYMHYNWCMFILTLQILLVQSLYLPACACVHSKQCKGTFSMYRSWEYIIVTSRTVVVLTPRKSQLPLTSKTKMFVNSNREKKRGKVPANVQ